MELSGPKEQVWKKVESETFWREIAHPDHIVLIYENGNEFLDNLVAFTIAGFRAGESVVVIATGEHLNQLDVRLKNAGFDLFSLKLRDQYITLDANQALYEFVIDGAPDTILFMLLVTNLMKRAKRSGRRVRAFGEMVAILWAQGNVHGTFSLEKLWSEYLGTEDFCLFCAYPRPAFSDKAGVHSADHVRISHSHEISSTKIPGILELRRTQVA